MKASFPPNSNITCERFLLAVSIVSIPVDGGERLFAIYWDEGLTEYQENDYISAEEVECKLDMKQISPSKHVSTLVSCLEAINLAFKDKEKPEE